jgi:hypothetical protein
MGQYTRLFACPVSVAADQYQQQHAADSCVPEAKMR